MKSFTLSKVAAATLLAAMSTHVSANTANAADAESYETITVTGQKIERSLQDTKESVSVITADVIAEMPVLDYEDLLDITPNAFSFANGENFGLRGITQNQNSTGGGSGELASLYVDGVAYTGFSTRFNPKDLWDVEQVEILRGPQSTNVGRNALIGALVVKTKRPELDENYGSVKLELGNYGLQTTSGVANFAVTDNSALRLTGQYSKSDGYITNVTLNDDEFDARENTNIRAQYLIEFSEDFTANLRLGYAKTKRGQDIFRSDLQLQDSFNSSANIAADEDYEATTGAIHIDYTFNDAWSMQAVTSFIDGDYFRKDDDDEGPGGGNAFRGREAQDKNWSQEIRFNYDSDQLTGVFGAYYIDVELVNNTSALSNIGLHLLLASVPGAGQLIPFYPETIEVDALRPFEQDTKNYAFFTEWDYKLTDQLTLNAGFRYDVEEQDSVSSAANTLAAGSTLPDPVQSAQLAELMFPGAGLGPVVQAGIAQVNGVLLSRLAPSGPDARDTDYNAFLPQVGITYELDENQSISAFYKKGYRVGGVDNAITGAAPVEYDPEYLDNYELAYRSVWLDGDLILNANAYFGDWTDQQVQECPNGLLSCVTVNAGESEISGLEAEFRYAYSDDVTFFGSLGLSDTEFKDYTAFDNNANPIDLSGNTFARSPEMTAAFGSRVYVTDEFYISGNINYQSDMESDIFNNDEFKLDSRVLINLKAGYEIGEFVVDAYVTNLTDKNYLEINGEGLGSPDARIARAGVPRQFGLAVTYNFE
ncbi:hypothetical protein DXX93_07895 [Thalassotalea euphylliae]|uniref:TonB-dependent receptor n=1 Tax=Thalassotalea euphylliae TaxID=1655234 RepID=A0A3E0TQ96_9GAMM|nr:TonB-dependent receptor [Thalassotalea euphylliae]REL26510.1 hypothetical protein DXX93_07895 [Thalassotalea euphylliae]